VIDGVLLGRMEIGTWQTRVGRFDVLRGIPKTATSQAEFEELSARAITSEVSGRVVRVADLQDIIRSKRIADRPKDREALPELEGLEATAVLPLDPQFHVSPAGGRPPRCARPGSWPCRRRRPRPR
jgi:hypothetical protein